MISYIQLDMEFT